MNLNVVNFAKHDITKEYHKMDEEYYLLNVPCGSGHFGRFLSNSFRSEKLLKIPSSKVFDILVLKKKKKVAVTELV